MPATLPSHPAAVLPLKLWRPRWFDGVALVVGAASPDLAYPLDGSGLPLWPLSHSWLGLAVWCLPATVALSWLVRRSAPTVAVHLPAGLRDYGVLGTVHPPLRITVSSALLGAASHIVWDWITHSDRWAATIFGAGWPDFPDGLWWTVTDVASTMVGAVVVLVLLRHIGRHRLLRAWHGEAPPANRRPAAFWGVAAAVMIPGVAVIPFLPHADQLHVTGVRLMCVPAIGLLAGAAAVRRLARWRSRVPGRMGA